MGYLRGHVENGMVVLDDPVKLPEGTKVRVDLIDDEQKASLSNDQEPSLGQKLLKFAGKAEGLPPDFARNHDHYLYGTPKK
jgi:predicted DNA-binding antitoxin AbrB/MazE fold protein